MWHNHIRAVLRTDITIETVCSIKCGEFLAEELLASQEGICYGII